MLLYSVLSGERRGLVPDQTVEREVGDHEVVKEIRNARDLAAEVLKREKTKLARDQEKKRKRRREREKDQQVVPHQADHQQVEVVVVALLPEKRTKTVNESEGLEAEAMKRERRKGLVAEKEKEIGKEMEKDVQEVAIVQLLLVHDQRVEVDVLNKKSLSQGIVLFKSKLKVCYESQLNLIFRETRFENKLSRNELRIESCETGMNNKFTND